MTNYTTNLCPNPSFEASLAGWSAIAPSTVISQVTAVQGPTQYGQFAMQVVTDGTIAGQGVTGPQSASISPGVTGSVTVGLCGQTGNLVVSAVSNPGGVTLTSVPVTLADDNYVNVVLSGLVIPNNSTIYVVISTATAQSLTFYVDGVMYEPESPAHAYCDGDQTGCFWSGTPELSSSFQPFQFGIGGTTGVRFGGQATVIVPGEVFPIEAVTDLTFTGGAAGPSGIPSASAVSPVAAMTDFGIYTSADPDPAQTYSLWNNESALSGYQGYARSYAMVVPPIDYPVSSGYAWRRAAYMGVGFQWASVPNGVSQIMADVQVEYPLINGTSPVVPRSYQRPRQLQLIVRPNRLNYITNPSFENSITGWSAVGTGVTLALDNTTFPTQVSVYNNIVFNAGTQSMKVTLASAASLGVQTSVPFLIPGRTYIASAYLQPGANIGDITFGCSAGGAADINGQGIPYGGNAILGVGYSQGPYGGVNPITTALPTGTWTRVFFSFVANADTVTLTVEPTVIGSSYPYTFWVDALVLEEGDVLESYFDGNSGADAMWETGGTPNLTRSYYYNQFKYGQHVVAETLARNTPYGITAATPLYAQVPTQ